MKRVIIALFLFLFALRSPGQSLGQANAQPIKGTFYVSVDDACTIFVNGEKKYEAGVGDSRSPELELKVGDRIVFHLRNDTAGRHFICLFSSTDGQSVVSFKHHDFKIVPDIGVTDFTPEQFQGWTKYAKEEKQKKAAKLPVRSTSDFMWGDLEKSILAGSVTAQMVSQHQK